MPINTAKISMHMTLLRYLLLAFCLLAALHSRAQFQTKVLEFPEYGFKIPFFANATRTNACSKCWARLRRSGKDV